MLIVAFARQTQVCGGFQGATLKCCSSARTRHCPLRRHPVQEDPTRFVLVEVHCTLTPGSSQRDGALCQMARHRGGHDGGAAYEYRFENIFPDDDIVGQ
jgi:hypothetical protein